MTHSSLTQLSQAQRILDYLQKGTKISPVEALTLFGCFRLAARIGELRNQGHNIVTQICRDVNGRRYARYHLEPSHGEEEAQLQEGVPGVPQHARAEEEPRQAQRRTPRGDA